MRTARLVGLSPDGMSVVVVTDTGDELTIAADDRLRAAVRGDRPRLGQLEIEMETSLSPRDIQTRIRGGATLEDVARVAGLPMDRVERFAAPVLAERDHVAITAMAASVRRRGETSGHRNLRITVTERLVGRGVDIDGIEWDAYRLEDGRWTVTADYLVAGDGEHAEFVFDPQGRFSVAGNEQARRLLGEQSPTAGPSGGDDDPTVDLTDELALVRATQERADEPATARPAAEQPDEDTEPTVVVVRPLTVVRPPVEAEPTEAEPVEPEQTAAEPTEAETAAAAPDASEPTATEAPLDALYGMLSGDDGAGDRSEVTLTEVEVTEVRIRVVEESTSATPPGVGLSDATAVPETEGGGWEPAIVVNFPVEPSLVEDGLDTGQDLSATTAEQRATVPAELAGTDEPAPPLPIVDGAGRADEVLEFELEAQDPAPPAPKPARKKRASVPSWDEIMFGGPRPPSR